MRIRWGIVSVAATSVMLPIALSGCTNQNAFRNCTAMHRVYPHGVGRLGAVDHTRSGKNPVTNFYRSTTIYNLNTKSDADHDGIACEAH